MVLEKLDTLGSKLSAIEAKMEAHAKSVDTFHNTQLPQIMAYIRDNKNEINILQVKLEGLKTRVMIWGIFALLIIPPVINFILDNFTK